MDARPPGTYSQARDQKTGSLQKVVATINGTRKPLGAYVYPSRVLSTKMGSFFSRALFIQVNLCFAQLVGTEPYYSLWIVRVRARVSSLAPTAIQCARGIVLHRDSQNGRAVQGEGLPQRDHHPWAAVSCQTNQDGPWLIFCLVQKVEYNVC